MYNQYRGRVGDSDVPLLVSCEWLHEHWKDPDVVVLDVTWFSDKDGRAHYEDGHLPGAVYMNVLDAEHTDLLPRNVPAPEKFQELARAAGVNDSSHVVLYDDSNRAALGFFMGSRALWTFKLYGHRRVSVLDGGRVRWEEVLKLPITKEITTPKEGDFTARYCPQLYTSREVLQERLSIPADDTQVVDTRPAQAYSAGHLPGAKSLPFASSLLDAENHTFKSVDQLKQVFASAGLDTGGAPLVAYCNSGMSSCSLLLALQLCGAGGKASLYHGGFTEWKGTMPDDKIEK